MALGEGTPHPSWIRQWAIGLAGPHRAILMLRAYFDESGTSDDPQTPVSLIAGCLADLAAWERFEHDWRAVLDRFGVRALHMRDYAHSRGEFAGWGGDEPRRREFLGALVQILLGTSRAFVGGAVLNSVFRQLPPEAQQGLRDPYFVCFQECMRDAAVQAEADQDHVELVFARRPGFTGRVGELFDRLLAGGLEPQYAARIAPELTVADPVTAIPLQVADLVAYELGQYVDTLRDGVVPEPHRWAMRQILDHSPSRTFFHVHLRPDSLMRRL